MNERTELTERERQLLEEIEEIVANGGGERREVDSLYGFCAHLASTVPQAGDAFRQRLEARLVARVQQQQEVRTLGTMSQDKGEARSPSWFQRLAPGVGRIRQIFQVRGGLTMKKGFALAALAALVIAISAVAFVPSVRAQVGEVIRRITLGAYSSAEQVEFQEEGTPRPLSADTWIVRTEIGRFGGNVLPGVDPTVRSVSNFEEAQASTSFYLRSPADLPEGYALREVNLAPIGGTHWALLFYSGPDHDIIIVQMPGGSRPSTEPNVTVAIRNGLITDGTLEEVDFDGRLAVWADGHSLMWEADDISYMVGGLDLSLEQALQIARSLH